MLQELINIKTQVLEKKHYQNKDSNMSLEKADIDMLEASQNSKDETTKTNKKSSKEKKLQKKLRNQQMVDKAASDDVNRGIAKCGNFWKTPKTK